MKCSKQKDNKKIRAPNVPRETLRQIKSLEKKSRLNILVREGSIKYLN